MPVTMETLLLFGVTVFVVSAVIIFAAAGVVAAFNMIRSVKKGKKHEDRQS